MPAENNGRLANIERTLLHIDEKLERMDDKLDRKTDKTDHQRLEKRVGRQEVKVAGIAGAISAATVWLKSHFFGG